MKRKSDGATAGVLALLVSPLVLQIALVGASPTIVARLDYGHIVAESSGNEAPNRSWTPPRWITQSDTRNMLCTDNEFPSEVAYCAFRGPARPGNYLRYFYMNTTHVPKGDVECVTKFENRRQEGEPEDDSKAVSLSLTSTLCYSNGGDRFSFRRLHSAPNAIKSGEVSPVQVDGFYGFRMRDVNYIRTDETDPMGVTHWITYRRESVIPQCEGGSSSSKRAMVFFSLAGVSSDRGAVGGRDAEGQPCQLDERGRCRRY